MNQVAEIGTKSSGNWGHAGVPGQQGGSAPTSSSDIPTKLLAKGDGSELYRWSNVGELIRLSQGKADMSLDMTGDSKMEFSKYYGKQIGTTPMADVYLRVIVDKQILHDAGWQEDPHSKGESLWRHKGERENATIGKTYLDAVRAVEIHDSAKSDPENIASIIRYRVGRDIPVSIAPKRAGDFSSPAARQAINTKRENVSESLLPYARAFLALYAHRPTRAALKGCIEVYRALKEYGTASSGNWGHAGIPGQQGGSAPGGGIGYHGAKMGSKPIEEFPAYAKHGGLLVVGETNATQDEYMRDLVRDQGFDGPPEVVDKLVIEEGEVELFRGITTGAFAEQLKTGDYHAGRGIYGSGIYSTPEQRLAEIYANPPGHQEGAVVHMALRKEAKIIEYSDLAQKVKEEIDGRSSAVDKEYKRRVQAGFDHQSMEEVMAAQTWRDDNASMAVARALSNPGHLAVALGYDAIRVRARTTVQGKTQEEVEWVVLNRTALRVER